MSDHSDIEWTDATWNPVVGCEQISPGCAHCYAKTLHDMRHRAFLDGKRLPIQYAEPFEVIQLRPDRLDQPLRWRTPRQIFVNSTTDLFHVDVPDDFLDKIFGVMALASWHTFQVLTKRHDRMRDYLSHPDIGWRWLSRCYQHGETRADRDCWQGRDAEKWTRDGLDNVHLGVSVENQHFANLRVDALLETPAAVRFVSCEPLLEAVTLRRLHLGVRKTGHGERFIERDALDGWETHYHGVHQTSLKDVVNTGRRLNWIIEGGESGTGARDHNTAWTLALIVEAEDAGVPIFVKQLGAKPTITDPAGVTRPLRLVHKKGGDPTEWADELRVRQYPAEVHA